SFFKYVLATITGIGIVVVILFAILVGMITSAINQVGSKESAVPSNAVLYVTLDYNIPERSSPNPLEGLNVPGYGEMKTLGLNDILSRIAAAKADSRIKGIYLNPRQVNVGMASLKQIRDALLDF